MIIVLFNSKVKYTIQLRYTITLDTKKRFVRGDSDLLRDGESVEGFPVGCVEWG